MNDQAHVIQHDHFDATTFNETREQFPPLEEIATNETLPEAGMFVEDTFCAFFKPAPVLESEDSLTLTAQIRRRLTEEMMATAEYQHVRANGTMQDAVLSAIATAAVSGQMIDRLDRRTKRRMTDLQNVEQDAKTLFDQAKSLHQLAEHTDEQEAEEIEHEADQREQEAQAKQEQAQSIFDQLQADMERIEDTARRAARAGLASAEEEIHETNDAMQAYSGYSYESGQAQQRMSIKEKMALAQKMKDNRKLRRIAELAGKMVNTALNKQRMKVLHPPDEIVGVTSGSDLSRLLPSELLLLDDELTEMLFYQRYLEQSLLQFDMIGHEPQNKGAIIACVDESLSMAKPHINVRRLEKRIKDLGPDEQYEARTKAYEQAYTKEIWSKAVVLALLAIARHQRRDFCVVYFSSFCNIQTYTFPKAQATTAQLLDMAEFFFAGGTTFNEWMAKSLQIAEKGPFDQADVIVISDGDVFLSDEKREEYNTRRQAKKMHCYGILLGTTKREGDNLRAITDEMITITDLDNDAKALDMAFTI